MGVNSYDRDDTFIKGEDGEDGKRIGVVTDREGVDRLAIDDDSNLNLREVILLLKYIAKQLKITNLHLSNLSDYEVDEGDEER